MNVDQIMETDEFKRCAEFHGHVCPGLSLGFKAAQAAMRSLKEERSGDEELVAVVENDACFVDAVQVLTGCTFGKGNFIFKDYGKMVLTVFSRKTGSGVRLAVRPDALENAAKEEPESANPGDRQKQMIRRILEMSETDLFKIEKIQTSLPEKARIHGSAICDICGEAVMKTRLETRGDKKICRGCMAANIS